MSNLEHALALAKNGHLYAAVLLQYEVTGWCALPLDELILLAKLLIKIHEIKKCREREADAPRQTLKYADFVKELRR